ncbi:flavin reductase family protein [Saccharophagus degradans]|uniref:Flavin reductase family protein n=1 Tax=Saccharophagus degradans TaxID=86304 RepID=A0AAW7XCQ9_9GAMM|nr:flavin reductase family protein [Saccharophagus degradans]MDO6424197.1 flavin reductase family protein [Saccharophagus degradans]MDO6608244.1 flavin reductase family protein [Saccharophagus degradans]
MSGSSIESAGVTLAQQMRDGMRRLASGVCVVTANNLLKQRFAMTASSVTSLSDNPPSLLVCINTDSRINQPLLETQSFCINILSASHQLVSNTCASPNTDEQRFEVGDWVKNQETGLYYLNDAEAVFFCEKVSVLQHGTHNIFIGNITKVSTSQAEATPLIYLNGGYV